MNDLRSVLSAALWIALLSAGAAAQPEPAPAPLLLIFDASGSMWGQIEGENKIVIARRVLHELADGLAEDSEVGMIAYGHRREGDCEDIETVVPLGALGREALKATVEELNPKGKTPITASVRQAFAELEGREGGASVILISDGLDTCGGDPCAAVRIAKQEGVEFVLHVIGFDVAGEDVSSLECAARAGEGLFLSAENAGELSAALERAVAMPAEIPAGRLSVKAVADGELQDAAVWIVDAVTGEEIGGGRTYATPDTNPRVVPLPDGSYDVKVSAVGIRGDVVRRLRVDIVDGSTAAREVDYSTGELKVGATRNGELSDATYRVVVAGTDREITGGRTYTGPQSNPAKLRIVAGTYQVRLRSVEISGDASVELGPVTVQPGGSVAVGHDFASGTLSVGAARDGQLVDAVLEIVDLDTDKPVGGGRTYTSERSNPKRFLLKPGSYRVEVKEIRGERSQLTVEVKQGEVVERMVDPGGHTSPRQ